MVELGYTLSSEEHPPPELVEHARRAEEVGFEFASISDHYHPWVGEQGEASFVWAVLGGIAEATDELRIGIGVTCPTIRIHPAIIAQAVATTGAMMPERFFFGVGTGENLNEHVLGDHWPPHNVRLEMLEEAVEVIRKLWTGKQTNHRGKHYTVENAQIYTLPDELPPIYVSAYGEKTAKAVAEFADGFWCVGPQDVVQTYEDAGGDGPKYTQIHVCVADSEEEAIDTVYEEWPNSGLPGELSAELPTPAHFEQAVQMVEREDIAESSIVMGRDPDAHMDSIQECIDAGYDHVYIHQIGPDQEAAFEFYENEILPQF